MVLDGLGTGFLESWLFLGILSVGRAPNFGFFFVIFSDWTREKRRTCSVISTRINVVFMSSSYVNNDTALSINLLYLHISMSSGAKCFSHVYTLSLSINLWKSLSTSLVFVSSFSHCCRHCLYASFLEAGSFHIPIPLVFRHDPQPNTAQLSPGILHTTSLITI